MRFFDFAIFSFILIVSGYSFSGFNQNSISNQDNGRLELRGELILSLPEDCPEKPSDIVCDCFEDCLLYVLNKLENRIDVFNLNTKSLEPFVLNSPTSFKIDGFGIQDGFITLFDYQQGTIIHYLARKAIGQYSFPEDTLIQGKRSPYPYVQTLSPIKRFGKYLLMTGFRAGESMRSPDIPDLVLMLLDLESGKVTYAVEMPEIYRKDNWGGGFTYRMPYFDLGPNGDVVCCFAASEDLAVYSLENESVRYVKAPSRYIKKIQPFSKRNRSTPDSRTEINWYRNNPSYDGILYDKWREIYYRFALQPERPNRKGGAHAIRKPISIIVLDKDLRPLGETLLDEDVFFRPYCSFVSPDGLFIQVLDGDEDHLTFYQYQYEKNT